MSYQLPGVSHLAASAVLNPEFDLAATRIGSLHLDADTVDVTLNIIPIGNITWIIFLYHKRYGGRLVSFFSQIDRLSEEDFWILIVMHCENMVFAPSYVDEIPSSTRLMIEKAFEDTLDAAVPYDRFPEMNLFRRRVDK
jgi:hypothetical protein